jgi:RHS repeat-associated protein
MLAMENVAEKKNDDYAYEYSFDQNGNRINRQLIDRNGPQYGVDYSYDPENRLVLAQDYQIVGGGKKKEEPHRIDRAFTTLEYDGGGRRLVQHYDPKQGGNGVDKRDEYVFDGLDPVAEYNMLNGQRTDYYRGAGGHMALMHQYKGGTQGQMYWYHYNNKGDVAGLTKHNGNSHHNYRYDPYGAVLPENGNFTDPHNHYTLTGKEFDENTGLVWFGSRHYEPETGVWMGQDSYRGRLSAPGSLHRFGYVGNNPVSYFDWYGYATASENFQKIMGIVTSKNNQKTRNLVTDPDANYTFGGVTVAFGENQPYDFIEYAFEKFPELDYEIGNYKLSEIRNAINKMKGFRYEIAPGYNYENHDAPANFFASLVNSLLLGSVTHSDDDYHYWSKGYEWIFTGLQGGVESNFLGLHVSANVQCGIGIGASRKFGVAKVEENKFGGLLSLAAHYMVGGSLDVGIYLDVNEFKQEVDETIELYHQAQQIDDVLIEAMLDKTAELTTETVFSDSDYKALLDPMINFGTHALYEKATQYLPLGR